MLLKVNGEYLDFNDSIPIEKQAKIFEELSSTSGDFSYSFELRRTKKNIKLLGIPLAFVSNKTIYQNVACEVTDDDGVSIFTGQLRVQRISKKIECSFFSGNYNWMALLSGDLTELDFSEFDVDQDYTNISTSWTLSDGLIFPLMDIGGLDTRSNVTLKLEDFNACMYVKTIFKKIFNSIGIKFGGEIVNDFIFNNAIVAVNNKTEEGIKDRSSYAFKNANQTVVDSAAYAVIRFQDVTTYPYFNGSSGRYDTSTWRWTADVDTAISVDVSLIISMNTQANTQYYRVNKNGSTYREYTLAFGPGSNPPTSYNIHLNMKLSAGDYIQIDVKSVDSLGVNTGVQTGSTFKVTPVFLYRVFGNSVIPKWTKQQFVSNILSALNIVCDYNPQTKEITFNFFDGIKSKTPIDISNYVTEIETDFEEFISNFSRNNSLSYQDSDSQLTDDYNVKNKTAYAAGIIEVNNDFIQAEGDLITSDFAAPVSYINTVLDASIERTEFLQLNEGDNAEITAVADNGSGVARFSVTHDYFNANDLVRISESTYPGYNGDWMVSGLGSGYIEVDGLNFISNSTAKISRIEFSYNNSSNVFLMINIPAYTVSNFSSKSIYYIEQIGLTQPAFAYFNLLDNNTNVIDDYRQGLAFGSINNDLATQKTILQTYWRSAQNILNDPVKLFATAYLPKSVFLSLTSLTPVYLNNEETTNEYYVNRITGYEKKSLPCIMELIKL